MTIMIGLASEVLVEGAVDSHITHTHTHTRPTLSCTLISLKHACACAHTHTHAHTPPLSQKIEKTFYFLEKQSLDMATVSSCTIKQLLMCLSDLKFILVYFLFLDQYSLKH